MITVDFGRSGAYKIYLLDSEHDGELIQLTDQPVLNLSVCSCVLIKKITTVRRMSFEREYRWVDGHEKTFTYEIYVAI